MLKRQALKLLPTLALITLSACATNPDTYRAKTIDAPTFENTKIVSVQANNIRVINKYTKNKLSGDNGHNYVADPSEVLEEYLNTRFQATGQGEPITFIIDQASLIYNHEIENSTDQDDDVYALGFTIRALSGGTIQDPENQSTIRLTKTLRQRRGTLTNKQKDAEKTKHLSETIATFDKKLFRALNLEPRDEYNNNYNYGHHNKYGYGGYRYGGYRRYGYSNYGYGHHGRYYGSHGYGHKNYGHIGYGNRRY